MTGPLYGSGRRDANEPEIVRAFEEGGANVARLSASGLPDLLVSFLGVLRLVEIKRDRAKLRASQEAFRAAWSDSPIYVVRTAPQARAWLARWRGHASQRMITGDDELRHELQALTETLQSRVRRLRIRPNDIVVLESKKELPADAAQGIVRLWSERFPGKAVVLSGLTLSAVLAPKRASSTGG